MSLKKKQQSVTYFNEIFEEEEIFGTHCMFKKIKTVFYSRHRVYSNPKSNSKSFDPNSFKVLGILFSKGERTWCRAQPLFTTGVIFAHLTSEELGEFLFWLLPEKVKG